MQIETSAGGIAAKGIQIASQIHHYLGPSLQGVFIGAWFYTVANIFNAKWNHTAYKISNFAPAAEHIYKRCISSETREAKCVSVRER